MKNCTCEYCCSVQDHKDDRRASQEYDVADWLGKDIFNSLKIGDTVQYYKIPIEERNIVYLPAPLKLEEINKCATKIFKGIVISKTQFAIKVKENDNNFQQILNAAACWSWGLHKIEKEKTFTMEELLSKMEKANKAYAKAVIAGEKWDYGEWTKTNMK